MPSETLSIQDCFEKNKFINHTLAQRTVVSLEVLIERLLMHEHLPQTIDKSVLDVLIAKIDVEISDEVNRIKNDPAFLALEATWRELDYLLQRQPPDSNSQIEIINLSKKELRSDFLDQTNLTHSGLFHHIYTAEYDTPGGEPFAAMICHFEFDCSREDMDLLHDIAQVASHAHCPFIANVAHDFFQAPSMSAISQMSDLKNYCRRSEFYYWQRLRQQETSRYLGLCFGKFQLRSSTQHAKQFQYYPSQQPPILWGHSSTALASNLLQSFHDNGWCVNIRGPNSGGLVRDLPGDFIPGSLAIYRQLPVDIILCESDELILAEFGLIPLVYYKNTDTACFFSINSVQQPSLTQNDIVDANNRINARLPYIFLSSRIAHYLKVLQREVIGSQKTATELEQSLNAWLQGLITKMNNPGAELLSRHPLADGYVTVDPIQSKPGQYRVNLFAKPHFQVEGFDVTLNLATTLPGKLTKENQHG